MQPLVNLPAEINGLAGIWCNVQISRDNIVISGLRNGGGQQRCLTLEIKRCMKMRLLEWQLWRGWNWA